MSPLSYDYSYKAYKHRAFLDERCEEYQKLKDVLEKFTYLRARIFELRYLAEQVDVEKIDEIYQSSIDELILIQPVIVKLSEAAEFISSRDLADWEKRTGGRNE